jgi:UDP-glucose 4-epimerase
VTKRVIVSGATGFIGASVVRELLARGAAVTALIRPDSDTRRLRGLDVDFLYDPHRAATDWSALRSENPDTFIHCAWRGVAGRDRNEEFQTSENVALTLKSVDLANALGCSQWIGLGSQAEYGNQNKRMDESAPLLPTTRYGEAKKAAGINALSRCASAGMAGVWVRIFSTYGPDDSPHWLIPYVIREFLAGREPRLTLCEQEWDYLYIDDAASAIASLADGQIAGVFNLGSGTAYPLRTYVDAAQREVGTAARPLYGAVAYRPDQVMHLEADISRLVAASSWRPMTTIADGIRATVAFERRREVASVF